MKNFKKLSAWNKPMTLAKACLGSKNVVGLNVYTQDRTKNQTMELITSIETRTSTLTKIACGL